MTTREPQDNIDAAITDGSLPTVDAAAIDRAAAKDAALFDAKKAAKRTDHSRSRATYFGWIVGIIVTIFLLIFIVRNQQSQDIDLLFWKVNLPVGVSLLIAAIAGAIITFTISAARILQLRSALKKLNKASE